MEASLVRTSYGKWSIFLSLAWPSSTSTQYLVCVKILLTNGIIISEKDKNIKIHDIISSGSDIMIGNYWDQLLKEEFSKPYFQELLQFVQKEYQEKTIYPKQTEIFNAFRYTPYDKIKVMHSGINANNHYYFCLSKFDVFGHPATLFSLMKKTNIHIPISLIGIFLVFSP